MAEKEPVVELEPQFSSDDATMTRVEENPTNRGKESP